MEGKKNRGETCGSATLGGNDRDGRNGRGRSKKKNRNRKGKRGITTGMRVVTFPFEIRLCTYGFQNVARHK